MENDSQRVGLIRDLSLFDITMVGVGAMIGAGIFVLTGIAAGTAGPALILAFVLNGIITVFTAMVYAELGSAIPEAGGGYLWVKEGLPAWNAFLAGWMSWFAHAVAGSLYALGFGAYFHLMFEALGFPTFGLSADLFEKLFAVAAVLAFTGINFKGVSETGKIGNAVTLGKIVILAIFIISGIVAVVRHPVYLEKFTPFAPNGMSGVLTAMGLTFIAFEGYEIIVQAGEEVVDPKKNIPKAVFLSLAIVVPIYILVAFAAVGAVVTPSGEPTWQWLASHAELGLAEAARQFMPLGTTLLLIGGLLSTMSALNATTFSSTRVAFAMGRDRNLPDLFGYIHERTRTPFLALAFSSVLILFMALAMPIEKVAAAADVMFLLLFLQVNIAVLTIRKKFGDKLDYGYLTPFFPYVPILGIVTKLFLAVFMFNYSPMAWFFVIGWIAAGLLIYHFYAAPREHEKVATPVVLEERAAVAEKGFGVLVAVARPETMTPLIDIASRIARAKDGHLLLLHVATVPWQTPLRGNRRIIERVRPVIDAASAEAERREVASKTLVRVGHNPSAGIIHTVAEQHVNFLVMGWRGRSQHPNTVIGRNIDEVIEHSRCNVLIAHQHVKIPARHILVPVAHPSNAPQLVGIARLLSDTTDPQRTITVIYVVKPDLPSGQLQEQVDKLKESLAKRAFFDPPEAAISLDEQRITFEVVKSHSIVKAVSARTKEADLVIIGSSQRGWLYRRVFGNVAYQVAQRAQCPVIMLNTGTGPIRFGIQRFFQFFRDAEDAPTTA